MPPRNTQRIEKARALRGRSTDAERRLWLRLRGRGLDGHKFRRQHPIGPYFGDFVNLERRLVVELDGGQHADTVDADADRTRLLQVRGFQVVRFWDHDVSFTPTPLSR